MIRYTNILMLLLLFISCGKSSSSNGVLSRYPAYFLGGQSDKIIMINEEQHVPMNFLSQDLTMTFDSATQKFLGHSKINFNVDEAGYPYFELMGSLKNITIDGSTIKSSLITDPEGQSQSYVSLSEIVSRADTHTVEFDYELPTDRFTFTGGGVRFLTDMTDLNGKFFEYWGPCGFEGDQFELNLTLVLNNGSSAHTLRTNGAITENGPSRWTISFPDYYSKSSFYVHLTNQVLPSASFVYQGISKSIPVEVYGLTQALVDGAMEDLPGLLKELEGDYGPYPHSKFLAYMNDRTGGMEYVGATITVRGSLDHELLHSWFARSVIPADGRSGWIDEAMASWRDYGYQRASATLNRTQTNLAGYSIFRKTTPKNSYVDGRALFAELDFMFKEIGGLKVVMKALHEQYNNKVITNATFWTFLESYTKMNLDAFQERYVTGIQGASLANATEKTAPSKHPTPLTEEEILRLR
jgi:hypothetical protein